jgi:hypothetical protein
MKTVIIKSYLLLPQHKDPVTFKYEINQQLQTVSYRTGCCNNNNSNNDDVDDNALAAETRLRQYVPRRRRVTTLETKSKDRLTPTPFASPIFTVSCSSFLSHHLCFWFSEELQKFTFCFKFPMLYSNTS